MSNDLNVRVSRWSGGCCAWVRRCHGYYKQWRGLPLGCGASSCASLIMTDGGSGASRLGSCQWWIFPTRLDACASTLLSSFVSLLLPCDALAMLSGMQF
jgi:hypothetical protein